MPYGITNAKIISGGSGGGDTVYAVSETALNKDDKVYLNKHYYDGYEAEKTYTGANASQNIVAYCYNNGDFLWTVKGTLYWSYYNSESKSWTDQSYALEETSRKGIKKLDDYMIVESYGNITATSQEFFVFKTEAVAIKGKILRKDLALTYTTTKQFNLVEIVNPQTGEMGQVYSTVAHGGAQYLCSASICGNILLTIDTNSKYNFYDISDLTSPILLNTGTSGAKAVTVFTGLTEGNYVFVSGVGYTTGSTSGVTRIYKIDKDYNLVSADDLPSEFYIYMSNSEASYIYNPENYILSIGTNEVIKTYKWDGAAFKSLNKEVLPPEGASPDDGYTYCLFWSEDMKTSTIMWVGAGSSSYLKSHARFYKMANNNNNWYAEDYIHSNAISLQGFATGKTNDKGEYEISTVLPKKINLTINTNVDTEVEIFGSVE